MSRKRSSHSQHGPVAAVVTSPFIYHRPVTPLALEQWKNNTQDEPYNGLVHTSNDGPAPKKRNVGPVPSALEIPHNDLNVTAIYDPADYFKATQPLLSPTFSFNVQSRDDPSQPRLSSSPHASSLSHSPSTLMSDDLSMLTPATSVNMSRDNSLRTAMSMMRVKSQTSNSEMNLDDASRNFNSHTSPSSFRQDKNTPLSPSLSVSHVGGVLDMEHVLSCDQSKSFSTPLATVQEHGMSRSVSLHSLNSSQSRLSRRSQEVAQGIRQIAPKEGSESMSRQSSSSSENEVIQNRSEGGTKVVIPRKPGYQRPVREKIMCDQCNTKRDGFRGPHELRRHIENVHATTREAFVCVDRSPDKQYLAKCKSCSSQKKYHAEYNAAAHLRRIHFHPKTKGKGKKDAARRGGSGGGEDPPMDVCRLWMEKVKEVTKDQPSFEPDDEEEILKLIDDHAQDISLQNMQYPAFDSLSSSSDSSTCFSVSMPPTSQPQLNPTSTELAANPFSLADSSDPIQRSADVQSASSMQIWPSTATTDINDSRLLGFPAAHINHAATDAEHFTALATESVSNIDDLPVLDDFDLSKSSDPVLFDTSSFEDFFSYPSSL